MQSALIENGKLCTPITSEPGYSEMFIQRAIQMNDQYRAYITESVEKAVEVGAQFEVEWVRLDDRLVLDIKAGQ